MTKTKQNFERSHQANEVAPNQRSRRHLAAEHHGAITYQRYTSSSVGGQHLAELVGALKIEADAVSAGDFTQPEAVLTAQAYTLDAIFHNLARRSIDARDGNTAALYLKLALKAQSQSRTSIEALVDIKAPKAVAFVRQANIAQGHQQVNNGTDQSCPEEGGTAARGKKYAKSAKRTKQVIHDEQQTLDGRCAGEASGKHPSISTVGTIDRSENK